jgi:hypothetical protein
VGAAAVSQFTLPLEHAMRVPRHGPYVCRECFNLTSGFVRCYACATIERHLDLVVPISYSVAHEPLHLALVAYKRAEGPYARVAAAQLAAVLGRFLFGHERCLGDALGGGGFDLVTTVPSSDRARDEDHPLRWIVGELVESTRGRHARLLVRSADSHHGRVFDPDRFEPTRSLAGERVLLIDDTWTTGANAHSAACALKRAGASTVAAVVIGRHVNRDWDENDLRLRALAAPFDWGTCCLCAAAARERASGATSQRAA